MWFSKPEPPKAENYLRDASPNESRCIVREHLDFYRALVVGGIYQFSEPVDVASIFTYTHALRTCVYEHPHMSMTAANADTNSPYFVFCPRLDLSQHIQLLKNEDENEIKSIQRALPIILDAAWPPGIPPWKISVLPLSDRRCFIGFSFSHSLGDGISGLTFHKTFLSTLQEGQYGLEELICMPTMRKLNPPFDTPENLPISWSFLLSPLLGVLLPGRIASLFGFHATTGSVTPGTWTASSIHMPKTHRTGVEILSIDAITVEKALTACRLHGAKMTGLLHQFIIDALSETLPLSNIDSFSFGTAIDMRGSVGVSRDEMGLFVSGDFQLHPIESSKTQGEFSWSFAKSITDRLAIKAKQVQDQPTGLLRYVPDMRSWTLSKIGQERDSSYEISNLVTFKPSYPTPKCSMEGMVFSQPLNVASGPLCFGVVSVFNGPMNITASWQMGSLDLGSDEDEEEFVSKVCQKVRHSFGSLA